ncbi:MAG: acyltransferase family protein [Clostridiales bacterium]|nr:acyltransferase family protein [Clostridiales bacterium]
MIEFNCTGYLRLILMLFVCIWAFGCPEPTGIVRLLSGFAIPAFFILSGYHVLDNKREERLEKTLRKIKRTALCTAFVLLFYVALNIALIFLFQMKVEITKRVVFEFLVLNLWPLPIGDNFWFIQAMLYAYIVIFIADKLKFLRFYRIILVILLLIMLVTGEFAGAIRFSIFGYPFIPGNWLTRALPYILIGRFMREKKKSLMKVQFWKYLIAFLVGGGLSLIEAQGLSILGVLNYQGHMIGFGIMAVAVCGLAISIPIERPNRVIHFDSAISGLIYVLMNPVYYGLALVLISRYPDFVTMIGGIAAFLISLILALILCGTLPGRVFFTNWDMRLADAVEVDELD